MYQQLFETVFEIWLVLQVYINEHFVTYNLYRLNLQLSLAMVKINANDLLDLLSNIDIKTKLSEIFIESVNSAVESKFDKLIGKMSKQVDDLNATITALRIEMSAKDASIIKVEQENQQLRSSLASLSCRNEELQEDSKRDNLIFSGFKPNLAESVAAGREQLFLLILW